MTQSPLIALEALEPRRLLSAALPTNNEQYMLELVNRARANPDAEAARYGIDLNEGLAPGTISSAAKQPLAFNRYLIDSARKHSQWMIDNDLFQHEGAGGSSPDYRMASAGYYFDPFKTSGWAENIAYIGYTIGVPDPTNGTLENHRNLFVDEGVAGRGHRLNILEPEMKEVGIGITSGVFTDPSGDLNALMVTQDFAYVLPSSFLTGVVFYDHIKADHFYTPREGLGGITITARRLADGAVFSTKTWSSGGYTLKLFPATYSVSASGGVLGKTMTYSSVVIGADNVKRDFVPANIAPSRTLKASSITTSGARTFTFQVAYADADKVKALTVGKGDIKVTGPNGFSQTATFISKTPTADATKIVATYRITAPGGTWNAADNGTYYVSLRLTQISDIKGLFSPKGQFGHFSVFI